MVTNRWKMGKSKKKRGWGHRAANSSPVKKKSTGERENAEKQGARAKHRSQVGGSYRRTKRRKSQIKTTIIITYGGSACRRKQLKIRTVLETRKERIKPEKGQTQTPSLATHKPPQFLFSFSVFGLADYTINGTGSRKAHVQRPPHRQSASTTGRMLVVC